MRTKNVLILGASGGIGAACARAFDQSNWRCALQYNKNAAVAQALAAELNDAYTVCADLNDPAQARRCVSLAQYHLGRIDAVVYCAGQAQIAPFTTLSDEAFMRMYELHVLGAVRIIRAALDDLIGARGSVVVFSSMWGQVGASCESHYAAAKGAVIALCKSLAKEFAVYGIRVNCVSPGLIDTRMNAALDAAALAPVLQNTPLARAGTPQEAAACALFLCSDAASFITGQVLSPNGGFVL